MSDFTYTLEFSVSVLIFHSLFAFVGQTSEISSDDKADFQIEPVKSNSKIKSKKGPTKSTKRNKELR